MIKKTKFGVVIFLIFCMLFVTACKSNTGVSGDVANQGNLQDQLVNENNGEENNDVNDTVAEDNEDNQDEAVDDEITDNSDAGQATNEGEDSVGDTQEDVSRTEEEASEEVSDTEEAGDASEQGEGEQVTQEPSKEDGIFYITKESCYSVDCSGNLYYENTYKYNEKHLLVEECHYHPFYNQYETWLFEYDEFDRVIKEIYYYDIKTSIGYGQVTIFEYDDKNQVSKQYTYYEDTPDTISKTITYSYSYNETGQLIREESSDGNVVEYEYNEQGLKIKQITNGVATYFEYDENGNLIQISNQPPSSSLMAGTVYYYDENGNLIKKKINNWKKSEWTYEYEFDQYGQKIKCTVYIDGEYYQHIDYEYIDYTP